MNSTKRRIVLGVGAAVLAAVFGQLIYWVVVPVAPYPYANMSWSNLAQIGLELAFYDEDHHDVMPPMADFTEFKNALSPYTKNPQVFVDPLDRDVYEINPLLSKAKVSAFKHPEEIVVVYEPKPADDGSRGVLFLNCQAARLDAAQWQRVAKLSKLSD